MTFDFARKGASVGGGLNRNKDVSRQSSSQSRSLLAAVAEIGSGIEASGGALATTDEYCAREHRLPFKVTADAAPKKGDTIRLIDSNPPRLVGDDGEIGVVDKRVAGIQNCLSDDWEMTGTIAAINPSVGHGIAVVRGHH
ncbi:MAG TPA: hypothetical protein VFJ64_03630 [Solirubrobacterales bacterium]|nr:hypothetical protein [Solirubrobacterales bacterium]